MPASALSKQAPVCGSSDDCEARIEAAARRGVEAALKAVGLGDEHAAKDVQDMRTLLSAWRDTKSEMWKTVLHWTITAVLGGIGFLVYSKTGVKAP